MNQKIGVYICHCGSNISDVVDVEEVKKQAEKIENVVLAKTMMFACADSSQKEMVEDIRNLKLDAMVVASCSPKLHLYTFRAVAERAGLNYNKYEQVNIREQDSWAHGDQPVRATRKAIQLIKMAVSRVKLAEALHPVEIEATKSVLIIGGGVSGLRSGIELADMGIDVYIIEKEHFFGGHISEWDEVYMSNQSGNQLITDLYREVKRRDNIRLFTGASLLKRSGSVGNFEVTIQIKSRNVKPGFKSEDIEKVLEVCPVVVKSDESDFNGERKAIYYPARRRYPELPFIDMTLCNLCGECLKYSPEIDLAEKDEELTLHVGAILISTGFDHYQPPEGEYGYKKIDRVITLPVFKHYIENAQEELIVRGKKIKNIAYIYCVGSRQTEGTNKYCSRYCCTSAVHTAIEAKKKFPQINNFHFNRGIRTYGKQEILYHNSCEQGDVYLQFNEENPVTIEQTGDKVLVKVNDILTECRELELEADLVVLITAMVPRTNNELTDILKVPAGRDGFFNEVHPKLKPVETVIDGLFIAGCCQGPKNITESVRSALLAAAKIYGLVGRERIEIDPIQAKINEVSCIWCGICAEACPVDAIDKERIDGKYVAKIIKANCKGCGMCVPVCDSNAIDLVGYSDTDIESMIDALVEK